VIRALLWDFLRSLHEIEFKSKYYSGMSGIEQVYFPHGPEAAFIVELLARPLVAAAMIRMILWRCFSALTLTRIATALRFSAGRKRWMKTLQIGRSRQEHNVLWRQRHGASRLPCAPPG
jgi:hypothetical protein